MSDIIVQNFRFCMSYVCNALESKKNSCMITWLEYAKFSLYEKWNNCLQPQLPSTVGEYSPAHDT